MGKNSSKTIFHQFFTIFIKKQACQLKLTTKQFMVIMYIPLLIIVFTYNKMIPKASKNAVQSFVQRQLYTMHNENMLLWYLSDQFIKVSA